ncbi:piRNA biogenesis protein EXD1 [Nymphon striatum]|nr:piRNA biogenesis protein EXD1 [Nymphon striatum]
MDSLEIFKVPIGSKVKITTDEGVYTGVIRTNNLKSKKISFQNMIVCETNLHVGILTFHYFDIISFEVIKVGKGELKQPAHKDPIMQYIGKKPEKSEHFKGLNLAQDSDLRRFSKSHHKDMDPYIGLADSENKCDFSALNFNIPNSHNVVDCVDDIDNALGVLENERVLAVATEGTYFKRNGKLFWIQVASYRHVFLFDILALKNEVFDRGLRAIFQNARIQKVVHDCRFMSDIFRHQYNCELVNVFDTQVADVFISKENYDGNFSRKVNSYPYAVMRYLDVSPEYVYIQKIRPKFMEQDLAAWTLRPLSESMRYAAIKEVIYLLELRHVLYEKLMEPFMFGVSVYLSSLRDCDENERNDLAGGELGVLPEMFKQLINYHKDEKIRVLQRKSNSVQVESDLHDHKEEVKYNRQVYSIRNHDIFYNSKRHEDLASKHYDEIKNCNEKSIIGEITKSRLKLKQRVAAEQLENLLEKPTQNSTCDPENSQNAELGKPKDTQVTKNSSQSLVKDTHMNKIFEPHIRKNVPKNDYARNHQSNSNSTFHQKSNSNQLASLSNSCKSSSDESSDQSRSSLERLKMPKIPTRNSTCRKNSSESSDDGKDGFYSCENSINDHQSKKSNENPSLQTNKTEDQSEVKTVDWSIFGEEHDPFYMEHYKKIRYIPAGYGGH